MVDRRPVVELCRLILRLGDGMEHWVQWSGMESGMECRLSERQCCIEERE